MTIQECIDKWKAERGGQCHECEVMRYYSANRSDVCPRCTAADQFIKDLEEIQKEQKKDARDSQFERDLGT